MGKLKLNECGYLVDLNHQLKIRNFKDFYLDIFKYSLPKEQYEIRNTSFYDETVNNKLFKDMKFKNISFQEMIFNNCIFDKVKFHSVNFTNCFFDNCLFINSNFKKVNIDFEAVDTIFSLNNFVKSSVGLDNFVNCELMGNNFKGDYK